MRSAVAAVEARGEFAVLGRVASTLESSRRRSMRPTLTRTLWRGWSRAGLNLDGDGFAVFADGGLHGELVDVGADVLFLLPAGFVEALEEVALAVKESDADEGNVQVGCALTWSPARTPRPPE